ncbi:MAG TPA: hypothetical protein PL123_13865 [Bacteroidales bacterium]|nr:hypothetical protein [Bacteroidales bacterium]
MTLTTISILAEGSVVIPVWVISIFVTVLVSLLTTWGILTATKANLEVRAKRNEDDIQKLQNEKVNKTEFRMICESLNRIENKLDQHINEE